MGKISIKAKGKQKTKLENAQQSTDRYNGYSTRNCSWSPSESSSTNKPV